MTIEDVAAGRRTIASKTRAAFVNSFDRQTFDIAGADTWEKPDGALIVEVELVGGGGAGGGGDGAGSGLSCGGGGGSGGYVRKMYAASDLSATQAVSVGVGGTGAAGAAGGTGGATTFAGLTGSGGVGGSAMTSTTGTGTGASGAGGAAAGGDVNIPGEAGDLGRVIGGALVFTGRGGRTQFGSQPAASTSTGAPGTSASGYGSGGSGAVADTTDRAGGAGSAGICIVTTYF
ncbi:hypothetical protein Cme02nite_38090 [Catellatospora methionotrophica]|uniref:Glycine-rich domain-containing protein n=1 Tax=Catellatospora methionotrophica TaxID=121620 RepID=A0A8J3L6V4_9ACTN|nr:hypothetical protein [Catellatospora methionotrophica]GIG15477.1 hypothetical protein Cme02nite_38090 [Catellatospora methionotrophica]